MAAKIKLTDAERADVVDLYAIGFSTRRVIDYLLSTHPDWQLAPRHQINTAIRTCNPNHEKCAKKWKLRFEDTKGHFMTHRDQLIETSAGHAAEIVFEVFLKQSEILKSIKILPVVVDTPKDIIALMGTLLETVEIMKSIANPTANSEHRNSTADLRENLKHRIIERRRLQPENSDGAQFPIVLENRLPAAASDKNEHGDEHDEHSNGA